MKWTTSFPDSLKRRRQRAGDVLIRSPVPSLQLCEPPFPRPATPSSSSSSPSPFPSPPLHLSLPQYTLPCIARHHGAYILVQCPPPWTTHPAGEPPWRGFVAAIVRPWPALAGCISRAPEHTPLQIAARGRHLTDGRLAHRRPRVVLANRSAWSLFFVSYILCLRSFPWLAADPDALFRTPRACPLFLVWSLCRRRASVTASFPHPAEGVWHGSGTPHRPPAGPGAH